MLIFKSVYIIYIIIYICMYGINRTYKALFSGLLVSAICFMFQKAAGGFSADDFLFSRWNIQYLGNLYRNSFNFSGFLKKIQVLGVCKFHTDPCN
jgi:hypothetical protein